MSGKVVLALIVCLCIVMEIVNCGVLTDRVCIVLSTSFDD